MKLWVSSETAGVSAIDDRNLSKSYIQIEEDPIFLLIYSFTTSRFLIFFFFAIISKVVKIAW
jgi:hypothetical protein